jgi:lincosamide nucleotidyltransferase A/C/D/E
MEARPTGWATERDVVSAEDVLEVLGRLRAAEIDFWVEGGWGVDALLGEQTRSHDDLDLGVRLEDADRICAALAEFERSEDEWPSSFILRDVRGRKVDCHPLTFDENGDGWQSNRLDGPPHRWPGEELQARGRIGGVEVPCISPELQLHWHVYPDFDDVDWEDVRGLCARFGLEAPPDCRERPGFVAAKRA